MKTKNGLIGSLVRIFPTMGSQSQGIIVRVQDHLATQFTYSEPDSDDVIGIFKNDGEWHDEKVDRPWLQPGRKRRRIA